MSPTAPRRRSRVIPRAALAICTSALLAAAAQAVPTAATRASSMVVTNGNDMGAGSLRAALESGAREIVVATGQDILISSTLAYTGERSLTLIGAGQTVMADGDYTLLEVTNGANLTVIGLNFEGPGGFDIENQSTGEAGKGIFIDVRDDQTGTVRLTLKDVSVSGVANHGIHVSDCDLADDCGGGSGGGGGGSPASISVTLSNVTVDEVGLGKFDADGLRVDERDAGNIVLTADGSSFTGVGADGMELDEGDAGVVLATVTNSDFSENGSYCDPELLEPQLESFLAGAPDEAEFDESEEVTEDSLPGSVTGSLDDTCFEFEVDTYDSGFVEAYEYAIDTDDGFDIDEAGSGSLNARVVGTTINDNLDEGIDFDEEGPGGIVTVFVNSSAEGNTDDGFKMSEEDQGGVFGTVANVTAIDNGGKGIVYEEEGAGNLQVTLDNVSTSGNDDGDVGVEAVQEDEGTGLLISRDSTITDGFDLEGVELEEE